MPVPCLSPGMRWLCPSSSAIPALSLPGWCSVCWGCTSSVCWELCNTHRSVSLSGTWSRLTVPCPRSLSRGGAGGPRGARWSQTVALCSRGAEPSPANPLKEGAIRLSRNRASPLPCRNPSCGGSERPGADVLRRDPVPAGRIPAPLGTIPARSALRDRRGFAVHRGREGPGDAGAEQHLAPQAGGTAAMSRINPCPKRDTAIALAMPGLKAPGSSARLGDK